MKHFVIFFLLFGYFYSKVDKSFAEEENNIIEEKIDEIIKNNNENNITKNIEKILRATVSVEAIRLENINIDNKNSYFIIEKSGNTNEIGTGFLISEDGFIVTNHHVIENSNKIIVKIEGKEYQAEIVGDDYYSDIALLKVKNNNEIFQFLELNPEIDIKVGEKVIIIGNPYNLGLSVSSGIISAVDRSIKNTGYIGLIQTDANINKGNSGGPLFNKNGDIIGINSMVFSPKENQNTGIGFAIPIKNIVNIINKLKEFGYIQRGWLGIKGEDATEDIFKILNSKRETGILVKEVIEGSPADKAGILPSDIIISYNDKHIKDLNNLIYMIRNTNINSNVSILILRAGKYIKLKANIRELSINRDESYERILSNTVEILDMYLAQFDRNLINKYKLYDGFENKAMYVLNVKDGGIADKNGIKAGDLVLSINQVQLKNKLILNNLINNFKKNNQKSLILTIKKAVTGEVVILKLE